MKRAVVHVVGAGAAGLTAARALAASGRCDVVLHEASRHPGGRRRSFYDETLGLDIDTGNYPLISAWTAALSLVEALGARGEWREEPEPGVAFADFAIGERWRLRPNAGRLPWWLLARQTARLSSQPCGLLGRSAALVGSRRRDRGERRARWRGDGAAMAAADPGRAQLRARDSIGAAGGRGPATKSFGLAAAGCGS